LGSGGDLLSVKSGGEAGIDGEAVIDREAVIDGQTTVKSLGTDGELSSLAGDDPMGGPFVRTAGMKPFSDI
jgi:hypothetical protein